MTKTEERKNKILEAISELFGDTSQDREEQLQALEEIACACDSNIEALENDLGE